VPPQAEELARGDDPAMVAVAKSFMDIGAGERAVLRLFRVYADALRKLAAAEAELFETEGRPTPNTAAHRDATSAALKGPGDGSRRRTPTATLAIAPIPRPEAARGVGRACAPRYTRANATSPTTIHGTSRSRPFRCGVTTTASAVTSTT
jgi:hypothetical protein